MPVFEVTHRSIYSFEQTVPSVTVDCFLTPKHFAGQGVLYHKVYCQPLSMKCIEATDIFGNCENRYEISKPLQRLVITAVSKVQMSAPKLELFELKSAPSWRDLHADCDYRQIEKQSRGFIRSISAAPLASFDFVRELMTYIYHTFDYRSGVTTVNTSLPELFALRSGVCQDFARVMIAVLQVAGIECRYVSGYFYCQELHRDLQDQGASHAWVAVKLPGTGWIGVDPTNNRLTDSNYITVATGRDYVDVMPVRGVLDSDVRHRLNVSVYINKQKQ